MRARIPHYLSILFKALAAVAAVCLAAGCARPVDNNAILAPSVTAVSPATGPLSGGTLVTITGVGFGAGATVALGGKSCTDVTLLSSTELTCMTPAQTTAAAVTVVVTNRKLNTGELFDGRLAEGFLYAGASTVTAPTVASVTPTTGPLTGATTISITGSNFTLTSTVAIGGVACTQVNPLSSTLITCVTPATASAGAVNVVVTNRDFSSGDLASGTLTNGFTYSTSPGVTTPTVTAVSPDEGPLAGQTQITITGTNFTLTSTVTVAGQPCTQNQPLSATQITCFTAASAIATAADVTVTNRNFSTGELASGSLVAGFNYRAAPTVVSSTQGFFMGGTLITITGTAIRAGATATIGGVSCTPVTVLGTTSLTCVNPAGTPGATADIVVTNTDAQYGTLVNGFTWRQAQFPAGNFIDGGGAQGLAKDQTKNATRVRLVDLTTNLAAVWQEVIASGSTTQIRAASYNGSGTTLAAWDFFDNDGTVGLNYDSGKNATNPVPIAYNSTLFIAWSETNGIAKQIRVARNGGTIAAESWYFAEKAVPDNKGINIDTSLDADQPTALTIGTTLYVGWKESDSSVVDQIRVDQYNGNDGAPAWTALAPTKGLNFNNSFSASAPTLGTLSNHLYAMWSEDDGSNTLIRMKEYSGAGTVWTTRHNSAGYGNNCNQVTSRDATTPFLFTFNSKLYATWIESNGTRGQTRVAVYNESSPSFTCIDGTGLNQNSGNTATAPRLTALGGYLYAIWSEGTPSQIRVKVYNGNDSSPSWTFVDDGGATGINKETLRAATTPDLIPFASQLFSAWIESDGAATSVRIKTGK